MKTQYLSLYRATLVGCFLSVFLAGWVLAQVSPWTVPLEVTRVGQTTPISLEFGTKANAGDTLDPNIDVILPPPVPGEIEAAFRLAPPFEWLGLAKDFRDPAKTPNDWTLSISKASSATYTVSWNTTGFPTGASPGVLVLKNVPGSGDVNMLTQSNVTVTGDMTATIHYEAPPGTITQSIALNPGWNIASLAVTPGGSQNMLNILTPILGNLVKVIDEQGRSIIKLFGNWTNSIGNWSATEGYYIKVSQAVTLDVTGVEIVPPTLTIPLVTGWNIISYPCYSNSQNALTVVQPLINANQLVKVIDEQGRTIIKLFGNWTNSIGNMQPGEGYYVKVSANSTLDMTCGGSVSLSKSSGPVEFSKPIHFSAEIEGHPFEPMNIFVVDASVNGMGLMAGDELAIYDGAQCVGVGVITAPLSSNSPLELIASKDDGSGRGFREGHDMSFRLWQSRTGEEIAVAANALRFFDASTGEATVHSAFEGLGTAALAIDLRTTAVAETEQIPETYRLYPNHPNPFNPSTMISYDLPEATEVRLEIYDLTGNLIKCLYAGRQSAGHYAVEWDGTNEQGTKVVSGVHLYRLVTKSYVETKKMTLVK